ncbi:hypothetical protein A0H76_1805 [Hepatospora eriocheir]|uniref:Uncharacterized protein n=1 Tax=Hepatospora eriocheir TaxID=1081669 RepID=A0A1X0QGG3_9MICR|nr:hypothetical protein A0H76_1805 [Hepatospora eriocheir]
MKNQLQLLLEEHKNIENKTREIDESLLKIQAHKRTLIGCLCDEPTSNHVNSNVLKKKTNQYNKSLSSGPLIIISYPRQNIMNAIPNISDIQVILARNVDYKAFRLYTRNFKSKHNHRFEIYTTTIVEINNKPHLEITDSENNIFTSFNNFSSQFNNFPFNLNMWLYYK